MIPGLVTAKIAVLMDRFKLKDHEILNLTDRQIHDLYFHPRDKEGRIAVPDRPLPLGGESPPEAEATLEDRLQKVEFLKLMGLAEADYERLKREVIQKYGSPEEVERLTKPAPETAPPRAAHPQPPQVRGNQQTAQATVSRGTRAALREKRRAIRNNDVNPESNPGA